MDRDPHARSRQAYERAGAALLLRQRQTKAARRRVQRGRLVPPPAQGATRGGTRRETLGDHGQVRPPRRTSPWSWTNGARGTSSSAAPIPGFLYQQNTFWNGIAFIGKRSRTAAVVRSGPYISVRSAQMSEARRPTR